MSRDEVFEYVTAILSRVTGNEVEDILEETELDEELNISNFELIDIFVEIAEELNIKTENAEIGKLYTVKDMINYIVDCQNV